MNNLLKKLLSPLVLLAASLGFAQNYTIDTPQPGSVVNGVDPATLNVNLEISIFSKSGIGETFSAHIHFDNTFWIVNCNGTNSWCVGSLAYGWADVYPFGSLEHPLHWTHNGCGTNQRAYTGYRDPSGIFHELPFPDNPTIISPAPGTNCNYTNVTGRGWHLNDGSGLFVGISTTGNQVITSSGNTIIPYNRAGGIDPLVLGSSVDVDNNSVSDVSGVYTDTLATTALTYTGTQTAICGAGTGSTYAYTYPTSTSTATATATVNCSQKTIQTSFGCAGITDAGPYSDYLVDSITLGDGSSKYSLTYESQVSGTVTGRLASVTYPNGRVVSYAYTGSNHGTSCGGFSQGSVLALSVTDSGNITTYSRSVGTRTVTTTVVSPSPANNNTVYTYSIGGGANAAFPTQTQYNQGASTTLRTVIYCYNGTGTPSTCPTAAAPSTLGVTQVDKYTMLAGMSTYTRTTQLFDSYGNATETDAYDFGASTPTTKTIASGFGYSWNGSTSSPNCTALIGNGIMDRPCQLQLQNGSGTLLKNAYRQYSSTGHLIQSGVLTNGVYVTTSATYNTNGSVATTTDANGYRTTVTEGACNGGMPTVFTPTISALAVETAWDTGCLGAKAVSVTDPNGFPTTTAYNDPFWRPTAITDQSGVTTNLSYPSPNEHESILSFNGGTSIIDVYDKAYPSLNASVAQTIEGPSSSVWDTVTTDFLWDATGIKNETWSPACTSTRGNACSSGYSSLTHDTLARPLVKTDGGLGTITYSYILGSSKYDIRAVLGPAPAGEIVKQVQKEYNGLGQLLSVCKLSSATGTTSCGQVGGGTGFVTTFSYNVDGTLASAVRGSQTHSFSYDNTGRITSSTTPEGGTKQLFYDSAPSTPGVACSTLSLPTSYAPIGRLVKTYDANGSTTCYSYDQMGRNTGMAYSGTTSDGLNKYFVYDAATVHSVVMVNVKGHLAEAYTAATVAGTKVTDEGFSYTARGEISDVYQWSTHSGGWYHTTATYFANGALNTLAGISGGTWTFGLDGKGRPNTALQGTTNEVTGTTFNAADQPLVITFGLGDTDTYTYDVNTGRMASYDFSIGGTPKHFTGRPSWNVNGTLRGLTVVDGVNSGADSEICDYGTSSIPGYDEIGRLIRVNCMNGSTAVWGQNFSYDAYDNLSKTVPTGQTGTTWTPTYNPASNQYSQGTYDSNGNLLTDTFHMYTWNQDNHVKAITDAGMTMTYDAFGRLLEKYDGTSYWQELISPVGLIALMKGQTVSQFRIPLPGGSTALNGINFEHKDWLGSASFVSNRDRTSTAARLFSPYGEIYNNTGITGDVDFTGDRQDLVAGLYDTPNRELNPSGRWVSPDPAGASWNGYQYSTNPLVQVDPSGLDSIEGIDLGHLKFMSLSKNYAYTEQADDTAHEAYWDAWFANTGKDDPNSWQIDWTPQLTSDPTHGGHLGAQSQNDKNDGGLVYTPTPDFIDFRALIRTLLHFVGIDFVSAPRSDVGDGPNEIPLPANLLWIDRIVNGHSWEAHGEDDFESKEEYKSLILDTVQNATGQDVQHPSKGRTLFWNDAEGFAVWRDKNHPDQGTAYYPSDVDVFKKTWGLE